MTYYEKTVRTLGVEDAMKVVLRYRHHNHNIILEDDLLRILISCTDTVNSCDDTYI
jgi:hypothetical protein